MKKGKIRIHVDTASFSQKPTSNECKQISTRLAENQMEITLNDFRTAISPPFSKSYTAAYYNNKTRSNDNWLGQELFILDIDSKLLYEDCMTRCKKYDLIPFIVQPTFSCSNEKINKYRVIFRFEQEITNIRIRSLIVEALSKIFPEIDKSCNESARLFYGGKKIIHFDTSATIGLLHLITDALPRYLQDKDRINYSRNINNFCKKVGINRRGKFPYIEERDINKLSSKSEEYAPVIYTSIYKNGVKSSKTLAIYFSNEIDDRSRKGKYNIQKDKIKNKAIRNFNFAELTKSCQLYREFVEDEKWLYHKELFGIATNLCQVEGGQNLFLQSIEKSNHETYRRDKNGYEKDWSYQCNRIKNIYSYQPSTCDNFCPYKNECEHQKNMIQQVLYSKGKVRIVSRGEWKSLKYGETKLKEIFKSVMESNDTDIHIIKTPTALGKTELAIRYPNIVYAAPTHKLLDEIAKRMKERFIMYKITPNLLGQPLSKKIKKDLMKFYQIGDTKSVKEYLVANLENMIDRDKKIIVEYLESLDYKQLLTSTATVLTTHERCFVQFQNYKGTIIIDEDPLRALCKIDSVLIEDLLYVNSQLPNELGKFFIDLFNLILNSKPGIVYSFNSLSTKEIKIIRESLNDTSNISSNIYEFFQADYYIKSNDSNKIEYIKKRDLPKNSKIIILSATIEPQFYKHLFKDRPVHEYDVGLIETKGKIIQYPQKSFAKQQIINNKKKLQDSKESDTINYLKQVKDKIGGVKVITHKCFENDFDNAVGHFGSVMGLNHLAGNDLAVVGTHHKPPHVYLLYAACFGYTGIENELQDMKSRKIIRNEYEFYFYTFPKGSILREIQLALVEQELVQAIGRARLLRYDRTVTVFSNYPVRGAEFKYS